MKFEINNLLKAYEQNWEISPKGKEQWINYFFKNVKTKDLSLKQKIDNLNKFYKTDLSEEVFNEIFKNNIDSNLIFVSPNQFHQQLKQIEVQKIAFSCHNLIGLDYNKSLMLIDRLFRLYSIDQWNYETFLILLNDYDKKIKAEIVFNEFKKVA